MSALVCEAVSEAEAATRDLKKALACFRMVVLKNHFRAQLVDTIAVTLSPGRLELWSAGDLNGDLLMELPVAGRADGGRIVVPFRRLLHLVSAIRVPFLRLGIEGDRLRVTPAGRAMGIPIPAACGLEDYPEPPEATQPRETLALPGKAFAEALLRVAPFTIVNPAGSGHALERILLEDEPTGGVNLIATDTARLAIAHVADTQGTIGGGKGFPGFTPRETKTIARLAGDEESVRIGCLADDEDSRADAVFGSNWRVTARHETSQWPNWRDVMPNLDGYPQALEMETAPLLCALAEMRPLLEETESTGIAIHPAGQDGKGQVTVSGCTTCWNDDGKPGERDLYRVSLPAMRNTLNAAVHFGCSQFESVARAAGKSFVMRLPASNDDARRASVAHFESGTFRALLMPLVVGKA